MKVCLSCGQSSKYLEQADEISFSFFERKKIFDMTEKYPKKDMVLIHSKRSVLETDINWSEIEDLNILTKNHFIFGTDSISVCKTAIKKKIRSFYNGIITTFHELNALKKMGVCYVCPGGPLFFQMEAVKMKQVPIRIVPNLVTINSELFSDGVIGDWIRPENLSCYNKYIDTIEFYSADGSDPLTKEKGLYRVYFKQKTWPEELCLLITGLNYPGNNMLISEDSMELRCNCGQKCQLNSNCNICYQSFRLANAEKLKQILLNK